jgi:hydroxyacylglutathione hydrolase
MEIKRLAALTDNYIFLLYDRRLQQAAVVDPAESQPVFDSLQELGLKLVAIFNTHHHADHIGANRELMTAFPELVVYGGAEDQGRIPGMQIALKEGDRVNFAEREAQVFFVPGHTRAHIAYYFPPTSPTEPGELFCGDTLFSGGCGRLFEGTPAQMVNSLSKLRSLPDNTRVWCAHEYTLSNLKFCLTVDPENQDLQQRYAEVVKLRQNHHASIPSLLGVEKLTNPFLRWDHPSIQLAMNTKDPVQSFARLRGKKDNF